MEYGINLDAEKIREKYTRGMQGLQVFEQIQFVCPDCRIPGPIVEFFINPTMALLRGKCSKCGNSGTVTAVDLLLLAEEVERQMIVVKRPSWQRRIAEVSYDPSRGETEVST